jgi:tetratricopeptide (TPR) repeat protein
MPRCRAAYHGATARRYDWILLRFLRRTAVLSAAVAVLSAVRFTAGPRAALVTAATLLVTAGVVWIILPRAAHRAFLRGSFRRAAALYALLAILRIDRAARAALRVSVAACLLGRERHRDGLAHLDRIDPTKLAESARAAWHNNRAYALARSGGDPAQALVDSDAAIALRPDLSGFRHTRGLALLAQGRIDEAIRELDEVWQRTTETTSPLLEAERCYDIAQAWQRKGEQDYAADYFDRSRRAAPGSPWSMRSAERLAAAARRPDGVAVDLF